MTGGVHTDRAGADHIAADQSGERHRAGLERRTVDRATRADRPAQRQLADDVIAAGAQEVVVAHIGAGQIADRFDARIAPGVEIAAGAGVADGVHRHLCGYRIAADQVVKGHRSRCQRICISRMTEADPPAQRQSADAVIAGRASEAVVARVGAAERGADVLDAGVAASVEVAAGAEMARRVHTDRAGLDHVATDQPGERHCARVERRAVSRAARADCSAQRQLADGVVAHCAGKAVVGGIRPAQRAADRHDSGKAPGVEVVARAQIPGGVHAHAARCHAVEGNEIAQAHRARRQRCAIDRAAQANAAGQCALVDNIIAAICCNKFVVDRIRADQPADRLDARIAARGKVAAGAGVAGGIDRNNARRHAVTRHQIGAETHRTRCERIAIR